MERIVNKDEIQNLLEIKVQTSGTKDLKWYLLLS